MRKRFLFGLAVTVLLAGGLAGAMMAAKEQSAPPPGAKVVERPSGKLV